MNLALIPRPVAPIASLLSAGSLALLVSVATAQTPDWGDLQFPTTMTAPAGSTSPQVFGQVYKFGVTDNNGRGDGIVAQLGIGPDGSDPATSAGWQWTTAAYDQDVPGNINLDQYVGTFTVPATAGFYDYCYRYSLNAGPWLYADAGPDGSSNGYAPADAGQLTVQGSTGVGESLPRALEILALRNPFRGAAELRLALPRAGRVDLVVLDPGGRVIRRLIAGHRPAGEAIAVWDGRDEAGSAVSQGVYFAGVVVDGNERRTLKLIRLR